MDIQTNNLCPRCKKPRIIVKKWKEMLGSSLVNFTATSCPDKECQKILEKENQEKKEKRESQVKRRSQLTLRKRTIPLNRVDIQI